jgi:hypothetical protein
MLQAAPAFASAKADATAEFVADDVPATAIPAVVVPAVIFAIDRVLFGRAHNGGGRSRGCGLPEGWIGREACVYELHVDLGQGQLRVRGLRLVLHDRSNAIDQKPVAG